MVDIYAVDFLYPTSYSSSMVTPAHSNVSWCGLREFSGRNGEEQFWNFFPSLTAHVTKTGRARILVFGTIGECQMLYSN